MKIGILEAGLIRDDLADRFEPYPVMFERLLNLAGRDLEYLAYSPVLGHMPASIDDCDGWLITGSRHGVYEQLDWMVSLQEFIRELAQAGRPLIGVCFGHQIMAAALGGQVVKSDVGWKVGLQHYRLEKGFAWMREQPSSVAIHAWHQDQVVVCPPTAEVFLSAADCTYAGLSYGDSMISVQAHPEIEAEYERALLDLFSGSLLPDDVVESGMATLDSGAGPDSQLLADWFVDFFLTHQTAASATPLGQAES